MNLSLCWMLNQMPEITHTSYPHAHEAFGSGGQRSLNKGFQMEETLYHAKLLLFSRKQTWQ